jgi:hypothetical protein
MSDENTRPGNVSRPGPLLLSKKNAALRETIKKIIKANRDFNDQTRAAKDGVPTPPTPTLPFEYFPKEIGFLDVQPGFEYVASLTIQNILSTQIRIKICIPKSSMFSLSGPTSYLLVPGFSQTVHLTFAPKETSDFMDNVTLLCDELTFDIPVRVSGPRGRLTVEPTIDLGYVHPETATTFRVPITNPSAVPVLVEYTNGLDDMALTTEHLPLTLEPGETKSPLFTASFNRPGVIQGPIVFTISNQPEAYSVSFRATVAAFNTYIVDETGNELAVLNFGDVLVGVEAVREITLLNNAPVPVTFKLVVNSGSTGDPFEHAQSLKTPYEAGLELSQQVIFVDTNEGEVPEYSHRKIRIRFQKKPELTHQNLVSKFALSQTPEVQQEISRKSQESFQFNALFQFNGGQVKKALPIRGVTRVPLVTLSKQMVFFGDQLIGGSSSQEVQICSHMSNMKLDVETSHLFFLHCVPNSLVLDPNETRTLKLVFSPKSLGAVECEVRFKVGRFYCLKMIVTGCGRMHVKQGGSLPPGRSERNLGRSSNNFRVSKLEVSQAGEPSEKSFRINHPSSTQPSGFSLLKHKLQSRHGADPHDGSKTSMAINALQLSSRRHNLCDTTACDPSEPIPSLPAYTPTIYLVKPLKKGIPKQLKPITTRFDVSPYEFIREFPATPRNHEESQQILERLSAEKLMRIYAGPTELNFGRVFTKSVMTLHFHIKNDLWTSIQVVLDTGNLKEAKQLAGHTQIIPSSETGSFRVTLVCPQTKVINEQVKYTINGQVSFFFSVQAQVVLPELEIGRYNLMFGFREESMDTSVSQTLSLRNNGNLPVSFRLRAGRPNGAFRATPADGVLDEHETLEVEVSYTPYSIRDEELFRLEIEDGSDPKEIRCIGAVNEVSCDVVNANLNFGNMAIDQRKTMYFTLKNTHSKNNCIFRIEDMSLPDGVDVRPRCGKICTDESQKFEVELWAKRCSELLRHEIYVLVRGLPPIRIFLNACVLAPVVDLEPIEFDFGSVVIGHKKSLTFEMINKSAIQAEVHLSLQATSQQLQEMYGLINVTLVNKTSNDSVVLDRLAAGDMDKLSALQSQSLQTPSKSGPKKGSTMDKTLIGKSRLSKARDDEPQLRTFVFYLKPNRSYVFNLEFAPTRPLLYSFELMFTVLGQEKQRSLLRRVKCQATNPRFLFDPISGVVEFNRQVLLGPEPTQVQRKTFTIINTSCTEKLVWNFDPVMLDQEPVFKVEPSNGIIDEECSVLVTIDFRPLKPIVYEASIPIFFDNQVAQGFELKLRGEATPPKINLSTEEVILPITPLGVTATSHICVMNDGYQNSNFTLHIPLEYQKIGLTASFKGGRMLGINNTKIIVKVSFVANVPTSFTARVAIEDDLKHTFYFTVSGSTDNSLLSYAPFMHLGYFINTMFRRHLSEDDDPTHFDPEFAKAQMLVYDQGTKAIRLVGRETQANRRTLMPVSSEERSPLTQLPTRLSYDVLPGDDNLGPLAYYKQLGQTIKAWLVEYGVTTVSEFPEDVVANDGAPFFDFLDLLVKTPLERPKVDPLDKPADRVEVLTDVYSRLLVLLKENNALVNTVRPHFLLSHKELLAYFKGSMEIHICEEYYQVSESQYKLLSIQSWSTLFLQSIKIFCVSRIGLKDVKAALAPIMERLKLAGDKTGRGGPGEMLDVVGVKPGPEAPTPSARNDKKDGRLTRVKSLDPKATSKTGSNDKSRKRDQQTARPESDLQPESAGVPNLDMSPQFAFESCLVYSPSEAFLLRWLELTYFLATQNNCRLTSFGNDLANCYYFGCAVDLYIEKDAGLSGRLARDTPLTDDVLANFRHFKTCAIDFGIKDEFLEVDHVRKSSLAMLLVTIHLFKALPAYVPRMTVDFACTLHERVTKELTIQNPSSKPMMYTVNSFGSKAFEFEQDVIRLEPKTTATVPVSFYAATSLPAEGRVYFQNRKNGKSVAGALVFNLRAAVVSKFSMKIFNISSISLYELGSAEITVQNPFPKDAEFRIRLENVWITPEPTAVAKPKAKPGRHPSNPDSTKDKGRVREFIPSFFIKQERLWIRKGGEAKVFVQYLPISNESHKALINFQDPKVGEMQYELVGTPKLPVQQTEFYFTIPIEDFTSLELELPVFNKALVSAIKGLIERLRESRDFMNEAVIERLQRTAEREYDVELSVNDYFSPPAPITLPLKLVTGDGLPGASPQGQSNGSTPNRLPAPVAPKADLLDTQLVEPTFKYTLVPIKKAPVKDLNFTMTLKGRQRYDQRVYNIQLSVLPKKIRAVIEMRTTARVPITQNIPVTNTTDSDCAIRPKFVSLSNGHYFECSPTQFTVKRKSVVRFPLKFVCPWIATAECHLAFFNLTTNETFEYQIKAECEEPLSEEHLTFYAKAKSRTDISLRVRNPMPDCRVFKAECDIPNASFDHQLAFPDSNVADFKLTFVPLIGGNLLYSVTFMDEARRYFWYLLSFKIDSPESTLVLSLATEVRKPVAGKIELDNPGDTPLSLKVLICGDYLSGDGEVEVPPNDKASYTFFYFPVKVETIRRKIGFLAEDKSETWYDIDCRADEPKIIKLPILKTEIGKSASQQLTFTNPLKKKAVSVRTQLPERTNFKVNPRCFDIRPNDSVVIDLIYTPKELNKIESESLRFVSKEIGNWNYQAFGVGVPPTEADPVVVTTTIKTPVTHTILWKNPFATKIPVKLGLEGPIDLGSILEIVAPKQTELMVPPMGSCHLVVRFDPVEILTYHTKIVLRTNDSLQWVFPITAVAEAVPDQTEYVIKTRCEVEAEVHHSFFATGLTPVSGEEHFEFMTTTNHPEAANIERWLKITPVHNKAVSGEDPLVFAFTFLPHKPLKATMEFVLSGQSGGRWRYRLVLVATDPEFFDTLTIVSQLGVTRSIKFRLYNSDKKVSNPFFARFEDEGQSEFTISPTKGMLEPKINDGNLFEISYCPKKYGKPQMAIAIVETDQQLFRFLIKGGFEKYVPP